jgi:hypothetical protein
MGKKFSNDVHHHVSKKPRKWKNTQPAGGRIILTIRITPGLCCNFLMIFFFEDEHHKYLKIKFFKLMTILS